MGLTEFMFAHVIVCFYGFSFINIYFFLMFLFMGFCFLMMFYLT